MHTPTAAALAAGSVIDLVHRVAAGSLRSVHLVVPFWKHILGSPISCNKILKVYPFRNGLGLVRPPGHHAERAMVCS